MPIWRPPAAICVKVLGLAWRGGRLLVFDVEDDRGRVKGVPPPGGTIEFGETREQALAREFREELATGVTQTGPWRTVENLYTHEGQGGHEYIFAADIELDERTLYDRGSIVIAESDGTRMNAHWADLAAIRKAGLELYPVGLFPAD